MTFGNKPQAPVIPPIPADIASCFDHTVPKPKRGKMTKAQVIRLIAALKQSEAEKTECGRRLVRLYVGVYFALLPKG